MFDSSPTGRVTSQMNDDVNRRVNHSLDRACIHTGQSSMNEQRQSVESVVGVVGVNRGEGSEMAGVERIDEREGFDSPDFTDHEPIGAQSQRGPEQFIEIDTAAFVGGGWSGLESNEMRVSGDDFVDVFEHHDPFVKRNGCDECTEQARLSATGRTTDENVAAVVNEVGEFGAGDIVGREIGEGKGAMSKKSIGHTRSVNGHGSDDCRDSSSVGQTSIDDRMQSVEPTAEGSEDVLEFDVDAPRGE